MSSPDPNRALVFAALGDATRLALVTRLSDGRPRSISRLSRGMRLTRQGVTKHLRVLEQAGIVENRRVGRESRFVYTPEKIEDARSYLDQITRQWEEALRRLKAFVEKE